MKHLIQHLLDNNIEEILNRSLLDCHVKGLHSIMLLECPEKTIRLYVATKEHELYKNLPENAANGLSIAFHPHHCNLTLHVVKGEILNWVAEVGEGKRGKALSKWKYQSAIKEGETRFKHIGYEKIDTVDYQWLKTGECSMMKANEIHTVGVGKGEVAAWLVYEGLENREYNPYCWSNTALDKEDFKGLYNKPTLEQIIDLLVEAELIAP